MNAGNVTDEDTLRLELKYIELVGSLWYIIQLGLFWNTKIGS